MVAGPPPLPLLVRWLTARPTGAGSDNDEDEVMNDEDEQMDDDAPDDEDGAASPAPRAPPELQLTQAVCRGR